MTLPSDKELEQILEDRPGDDIYAAIKKYLPFIDKSSSNLKEHLVMLILADQIHDLAVAQALDEVGKILHYHSQKQGIFVPEFEGDGIIKTAQKLSYFKFLVAYGSLLGLSDEQVNVIFTAEVQRVFSDPKVSGVQTLKLSDELLEKLRSKSSSNYPPMYKADKANKKVNKKEDK